MKNNVIKKFSFVIVFLLMVVTFVLTFGYKAFADTNTVHFAEPIVEANESGIIIAEIVAEGQANQTVEVFYHTEGVTAISGLDFAGANNLVRIKIDSNGKGSYKLSIKCLNTVANREKFRLFDSEQKYGRY